MLLPQKYIESRTPRSISTITIFNQRNREHTPVATSLPPFAAVNVHIAIKVTGYLRPSPTPPAPLPPSQAFPWLRRTWEGERVLGFGVVKLLRAKEGPRVHVRGPSGDFWSGGHDDGGAPMGTGVDDTEDPRACVWAGLWDRY